MFISCALTIALGGCRRVPEESPKAVAKVAEAAGHGALPGAPGAPGTPRAAEAEVRVTAPTAEPAATPTAGGEARNPLPLALYLADRHRYVGKTLAFRVRAEPGEYFNCYYKDRKAQFHHLRLRDDGAAYLDAYVPRDPEGERLMALVSDGVASADGQPVRLTVKVTTRAETLSPICTSQVEILAHMAGWSTEWIPPGPTGSAARRLANARDTAMPRNETTFTTLIESSSSWVGRSVTLHGRALLDRAYQCRYRDAERTHFAVLLRGEGTATLHAYVPRSDEGRALVDWLGTDEGARITATVSIAKARYDELCPDQVELLRWQKGWR